MKKNLLPFILFSALSHGYIAFSQNSLVKIWDARFGGTNLDWITSYEQTADGGYILGGYSTSANGGDKTQPIWGIPGNDMDYWIVKIDASGNKQWDKDFGGTSPDILYSVHQTFDGGYILGGYSKSGISGDKTQPLWGTDNDFWIVKTDSLGNKLWDKDFGGLDRDMLYSLQLTSDGGFILGGISISGIGGDKTQASQGSTDYWILKTDALGNKQWDKSFGGSESDGLLTLQQTSDGGYILGGQSLSGISGDKTQDTKGSSDYWIIKTDSTGNKQWDKDFGGIDSDWLFSIAQSNNGGYLLGGLSFSNIGGDKTQNVWGGFLDSDYWILKTDSLGNKLWDKDFGGNMPEDDFGNIFLTADGGILAGGTSYTSINGDKTEANMGGEQAWIVKADSLGIKEWDLTAATPGHHETGLIIQASDGCYLIATHDGGAIGGYKSQAPRGNTDYWIVKFCDTSAVPAAAFTSPNNLCPGTCTSFLNTSVNATTFQWSFTGAIPASSADVNPTNICYYTPGNYNVTLIASNANSSDTLVLANYIHVYPFPVPQAILQSGDTLFANTGAAAYQWIFNGNVISGATEYFYVAAQSGNYNVVATDSNGCEVEAVINNVVARSELAIGSGQFAIFPNPVFETIDVRGLGTNSADEVSIVNVFGEKVFSAVACKLPIVNCQLPSGIYYFQLSSGKKVYRTKFIKQ